MQQKNYYLDNYFVKTCLTILLCIGNLCFAQTTSVTSSKSLSNLKQTIAAGSSFIENKGQYGSIMPGQEKMGAIQYGFEGFDMPVLFTPKGIIYQQQKIKKISRQEEEKLERQGVSESEIEKKRIVTDRLITMEWIDCNATAEIITEDKMADYHTYGSLNKKAFGYKKITYKNMYPGIDIVYSFTNNSKTGFEYSLIVQPGAI
jgi:hypothetical protein